MAKRQNINSARDKLISLGACSDTESSITAINFIREIFDNIEVLIISKQAKTEDIYNSIKIDIDNVSYSNFRKILSRIRKERGIEIRKRSSNKIKSTTPLSTLKNENKNKSNLDKPKEDVTLIDENFISPLIKKDRSHYNSDDFKKEWDLVQKLLDQNIDDKFKQYQILNGNMEDIEGLNPKTLHGVQKLSEIVGTAEMRLHKRYQDLIKLTRK